MKKRKKRIRSVLLITVIPLMLIAMAYIIVSIYYMDRFYPGTWINDIDFSNQTVSEAKASLEAAHNNYTFTVIERDGKEEVLSGSDIGHKIVYEGIEDIKKRQGGWLWLTHMSGRDTYTVEGGHGFDEEKLRQTLENLKCMTEGVVEPQNAYVDFSDGIKIVSEVEGNKVNIDRLYDAVSEAIADGQTSLDIDEAGCYESPEITEDSEEFQEEIAPIKNLTKATITLNIGPDQEVIDSSVSETFLVQNEDGSIDIDEEKVRSYMEQIEDKYQTWGEPHEFKTTGGSIVELSGTLGWSIDVEAETSKIIEELQAGEDVEREAIYDATAPTWEGNEIGDTYIEISINQQHMWFYKNGSILVETDVVTGTLNKGYSTPTGAYKLLNKARNQTLVGTSAEDPYESKVSYWLPFIGNLYGIHDASWRSTYGGTIYYNNGSHGCVNTPYDKVQQIYENIEIGTPVLIY